MAKVEALRRADWRFLLSNPLGEPLRHLVLLGGPDELPDLLRQTEIAERVTTEIPVERSADAVAVLDDSLLKVRRATGCLLPGGSLYCEFDRRSWSSLARSPGRVRRTLNAAGLSLTGIYWVRPDLVSRQVYVPLHVAGPLSWYLDTMLTASSPAARVLELILYGLARAGTPLFNAFAPCFGITAVAGAGSEMSPSVVRNPSLPPQIQRPDLNIVVITQGTEDFKRVTILPFSPSAKHPLAVLKIARLPEYNEATQTEQDILGTIRSTLDETMRESIPRPLGVVHCGRIPIGIESFAEGRSIASKVNRWRAPLSEKLNELHRATAWLTEFNRRVQFECSEWGASEISEWIDKPFADYQSKFGISVTEEHLFAETRRQALSLVGKPMPKVWVHWDFSEYNVHSCDRGISVLDWERGTPGPALMDLIFFATIWSFSARCLNSHAARLRGFRQLFCEPRRTDAVAGAVDDVLSRYMATIGIDKRFLPVLLTVMCVRRALIHLGRRADSDRPAGTGDVRTGNPYVEWLGVLAAEGGRFFLRP